MRTEFEEDFWKILSERAMDGNIKIVVSIERGGMSACAINIAKYLDSEMRLWR